MLRIAKFDFISFKPVGGSKPDEAPQEGMVGERGERQAVSGVKPGLRQSGLRHFIGDFSDTFLPDKTQDEVCQFPCGSLGNLGWNLDLFVARVLTQVRTVEGDL